MVPVDVLDQRSAFLCCEWVLLTEFGVSNSDNDVFSVVSD